MKVAQFLSAISTPKVQTKSLHKALQDITNKSQSNLQYHCPKRQKQRSEKNVSDSSFLLTQMPAYTNVRNERTKVFNKSCHEKKTGLSNTCASEFNFLRKGLGSQSTWEMRRLIGRQKRQYLRNYQRFTYQPPKTGNTIQDCSLRLRAAEATFNHKFCNFFNLKCGGCKCKLDCINHQFEEFLKNKDLQILKGLKKIVGRGTNLDSEFKSEIMNILLNRQQGELNLDRVFEKIRFLIKNKDLHTFEKKYLSWAKSMHYTLQKIQKRPSKIKKQNSQPQAPIKKIDKIIGKTKILINKTSPKNKKQVFIRRIQSRVGSNIFKRKEKGLSIRGSKIVSQHESSKTQKSESHQNSQNGLIMAKFKQKMKKYQDTQNKKRLRSHTPNSPKQSFAKIQMSNFYCGQNNKQIQQTANNQDKHELTHNFTFQDSDSASLINLEQQQQKIDQRLNLFQEIIHSKRLKNAQSENKNILENRLVQSRAKIQDSQHMGNYKKKFEKIRTSKKITRKHSSIMAQTALKSIMQNKKNVEHLKSEKQIRSKKKLKNPKSNKKLSQFLGQNLNKQACLNDSQQKTQKQFAKKQCQQSVKQILKQIKKNTGLIQRIQSQLVKAGLEYIIINQTDTLFTQKRKATHIRDRLKKGELQKLAFDIQRYLDLVQGKNKMNNILQKIQQSLRLKQYQQSNINVNMEQLQNQIDRIKFRDKDMKFYSLSNSHYQKDPLEVWSPAERNQQNLDNYRLQVKQGNQNKSCQFLYKIETYVTEKQRTPFDFYHFLELGNSLAKRKFTNERLNANANNNGLKEKFKSSAKLLFQKQLQKDKINEMVNINNQTI